MLEFFPVLNASHLVCPVLLAGIAAKAKCLKVVRMIAAAIYPWNFVIELKLSTLAVNFWAGKCELARIKLRNKRHFTWLPSTLNASKWIAPINESSQCCMAWVTKMEFLTSTVPPLNDYKCKLEANVSGSWIADLNWFRTLEILQIAVCWENTWELGIPS